jgi:hypothetical protein
MFHGFQIALHLVYRIRGRWQCVYEYVAVGVEYVVHGRMFGLKGVAIIRRLPPSSSLFLPWLTLRP